MGPKKGQTTRTTSASSSSATTSTKDKEQADANKQDNPLHKLPYVSYMAIWFHGVRKRGPSTTTNRGSCDSALSKACAVLGKITRATTCLCYTSQNARCYQVSVCIMCVLFPTSLLTFPKYREPFRPLLAALAPTITKYAFITKGLFPLPDQWTDDNASTIPTNMDYSLDIINAYKASVIARAKIEALYYQIWTIDTYQRMM